MANEDFTKKYCPICQKNVTMELGDCPFCGSNLKKLNREYQKYQELKTTYELLHTQIMRLNTAFVLEIGAIEKFKIEKQLEEKEQERRNIEERLENLENKFSQKRGKTMNTIRYNIVIVGQVGVGKSSLVNYLYGQNVRKTGVGKPITERGFHKIDFEVNSLPICLFDSWGLEVDRAEDWKADLEDTLSKRGTDKSAEDWFHTIFYCIDASSSRIQPFEIDIINQFLQKKYIVTAILTKADLVEEKDIVKLKNEIIYNTRPGIPVIPACSEEKVLRGGYKTEKEGKEAIEAYIHKNFWDSIILRLPERCVTLILELIDSWYEEEKQYLIQNIKAFGLTNFQERLQQDAEKFLDNLDSQIIAILGQEIPHTIEIYGRFLRVLQYPSVRSINFRVSVPQRQFIDAKRIVIAVLSGGIALLFSKKFSIEVLLNDLERFCAELKEEIERKAAPAIEKVLIDIRDSSITE